MKSQASKLVILKGFLDRSGLYFFNGLAHAISWNNFIPKLHQKSSLINNTTVLDCVSNKASLWHARLSHSNSKDILNVFQICKIQYKNKELVEFCNSCCLDKSYRIHAPFSNTTYTHAFYVVHTDLWRPSPNTSRNGYSYYISFVDTFSKYTWLYLLRNKSGALNSFKLFQKYVTTWFNTSIKVAQSDFGGALKPLTNYLKELGILHRLTCPHTSH